MKYVDEYRDAASAARLAAAIRRITTRPWNLMEICGGQTHAILRFGLDQMLPPQVRLLHGPGCPVCVTPVEIIDQALAIAATRDVIFCSFGDMLRVPGSRKDLLSIKAEGGDVRIVYSPIDAIKLAQDHPQQQIVFFAIGFETTAPTTAMAVLQAAKLGLQNFSILVAHVLVPPALRVLLAEPANQIHGVLAAGHVCTIAGTAEYEAIAKQFRVPMVVAGFEPLDLLQAVWMCVRQLEAGRWQLENQYARSVRPQGNRAAQEAVAKVYCRVTRSWRGIGEIPASGLALQPEYGRFDALRRFTVETASGADPPQCIAGAVLQGLKRPHECSAFAVGCTPDRPLGAPMVSPEGACAAYFRYRR